MLGKWQKIPKEKLIDFIFMHLRNMWAVDGLYYIGIEEKWGTDKATEVDRKVWEIMGKIEARRLKDFLKIKGDDIPTVMNALQFTGWALDLEDKEIIVENDKGIVRNIKCRVQNTRLKKGLKESRPDKALSAAFSCKGSCPTTEGAKPA